MRKTSLRQKVLNTAGAISIGIGSIFFNGGCESANSNDLDALSLLTGLASVNPDLPAQQRQGANVVNREINIERQRRYSNEAAKKGKTRVYVIYNERGQPVNVIENDDYSQQKKPYVIYNERGQPVNVIP